MHPTTTLVRTTVAAAILSLVAGLALVVPLSRESQAAVRPGLVNGRVEAGTTGYRVSSFGDVSLNPSRVAHSGARALRVHSAQPARARLHTTSTRAVVAKGTTAKARIWVRTAHTGQRVTLSLRETAADGSIQTRSASVTLRRGAWRAVRTGLVTRGSRSTLSVTALLPQTWHRLDVLVDDLALSTARPGSSGAPSDPSVAGRLSNGCTYDRRGLPSCGAYLGATYKSNTDPAPLESQVGRRLGVRRTFWTATGVQKAVATARYDVSHGRLPWISFKLPHSWEAMTAGQGDAWARDLARRLATVPGPVWVAFHHEPEGDGDITAWRTMQERLAPIVRRAAPNVAYTVVLTGWNQFFGETKYDLAHVWPRGVTIDVAGFDLYNEYGVVKNGKTITAWPDFDRDYYRPIQAWAAKHGVAWGVAETGYTNRGHAYRPTWIERSYDQLVARDGVAYAYFDTTLNQGGGSWALSSASKRAAFAEPLRGSATLPRP
ncbi:carbohydrate-binding protein CenC [Nocardioides plantarum]|uniref:GH26 domain-containing protein n=1 Tax=Nocardioides plantarum TaxID=29299 RepID=A0ABV5KB62_9ACTN|nr:carbohydrate-binding protein CenC [Nocardioides plantarum]